jgi:hypothetical protein
MSYDAISPITDIASINRVLREWHGGSAKIWRFHPSLGRMAIQIYRAGQTDAVYLNCVTCRSINGRFHWTNCQVVVEETPSEDQITPTSLVIDRAAPFELRCHGVVLTKGTITDFDMYND